MNNSIRHDSYAAILRSNLDKTQKGISQTLARMSSGLKVSSAKDDASGIVLSTKLNLDLHGINVANNNIQDGVSMFSTAESALIEAEKILLRLRDLSLKSLDSTCDKEQRKAIQYEADELAHELERIQTNTKYKDINLFNNQADSNKKTKTTNTNNNTTNTNNGEGESTPLSNSPSPFNSPSPLNSISPLNLSMGMNNNSNIDMDIIPDELPDIDNNDTENNIINSSITSMGKSGGLRLLGAKGGGDTGIVADNEVDDGVYITGAFDFAANEEYKINIDGVTYTVKNRNATNATISYSKEKSKGIVTFTCNSFTITGQNGVNHNIIINGKSNYIYGGDQNDTFDTYDTWSRSNYFYGQAGNDTFNITSTANYYYGGAGNDTFNKNMNTQGNNVAYGEAGDDTFNLDYSGVTCHGGDDNDTFNINYGGCTVYGNAGKDKFYVNSGSNSFVDGGDGEPENNNYIEDRGTNTTKANVPGANSYSIAFGKNETIKNIKISTCLGDRYYDITNRTSAQSLVVKVDDLTGQITFKNGSFTIKASDDAAQNVYLSGSSTFFYGSSKADTIYSAGWGSRVYSYEGNDEITVNGSAMDIYTGSDNDTVYLLGGSYDSIQTEDGNDNVIYKNNNTTTNAYHYINLGAGNDRIYGQKTNGTTSNAKNITGMYVYGGTGTNTYELTGTTPGCLIDIDASEFTNISVPASTTISLTIGENTYSVKNRIDHDTEIQYKYDAISNKIIFAGNNVEIKDTSNKAQNIDLYGNYIYFTGSNQNDDITIQTGYANYVYAEGGDDTLTSSQYAISGYLSGKAGEDKIYVNGSSGSAYGGADNDTIEIRGASCAACDGEAGNDTYYIYKSTSSIDNYGNNVYYIDSDSITLSAGAGDDTFYITGNNNSIAGGGGDDYFIVSGKNNNIDGGTGTNYIVDNGEGNIKPNTDVDPNAGALVFTYINEQHSFSIDDKLYMVKNCTETASGVANNSVSYTYNKNTGEIIFTGSNLTITACDGMSHTIRIEGDNNTIQGGNLSDTIIANKGTNNLIKGNSGDDIITLNSANNAVEGGSGNDIVTINATTTKTVDLGSGNDTLYINSNNNSDIQTGSGNDTVRSTSGTSGNTIDLGNGNNDLLLNGNNNTITASNGSNRISVIGNENNISAGSGANTIGVSGNNNTLGANGNSTFNVEGNENEFTLSGNNNTVNARGTDNEVSSIGNSTFNLTGERNSISSIGKSTIRVSGNNSSVISNGDSDITVTGLNSNISSIGNSTINQTGNSATIEAETGSINLKGNSSTLNAQGVNLNIQGNNNEIENIAEEETKTNVNIEGDNNSLNAYNTSDNVKLNGNDNTIALNNLNDRIEITGDNNTVTATEGSNTFRLRGSYNSLTGGSGQDTFRVNSGVDNVINAGDNVEKNTITDYGENTTNTGCIDITPRPLNVDFQVGYGIDEEITATLQFAIGDFYIDVSDIDSTKESMERIDNLLNEINEQRSLIGATLNRFENMLELNEKRKVNLNISKSLITDCDIAEETYKHTMNDIRKNIVSSLFSQTANIKKDFVMNLIYGTRMGM